MSNENFKIKVNWEVSETTGSETFDLSDMNCHSIEEWESLPFNEKESRIQDALDRLPERVFIHLEKFNSYQEKN